MTDQAHYRDLEDALQAAEAEVALLTERLATPSVLKAKLQASEARVAELEAAQQIARGRIDHVRTAAQRQEDRRDWINAGWVLSHLEVARAALNPSGDE
jgi:hypothetical protein